MNENRKEKTLLIIAMSSSIHTARWISQLSGQGWDIHLFPSIDLGVTHAVIENITVHHSLYSKQKKLPNSIKLKGIPVYLDFFAAGFRFILRKFFPLYRAKQLTRLIRKLKPDLIHSMETQKAGYLILDSLRDKDLKLPTWIHTIWGSDIFLFGRLSEHKQKIQQVLDRCDYYSSECNRDIILAKQNGFKGVTLPCFPINGGFALSKIQPLREMIKPSQRRYIIVKGYQNWAGRALVALRALKRCSDILQNYTIIIYAIQNNPWEQPPAVEIAARLLAIDTSCKVEIVPGDTSFNKLLEYYSKSRIYIGLSISDGICVSMLEALVTGAFPIQSNTSCANEWITDGVTGYIVPPEDPEEIEQAIRKALSDDVLVDNAAIKNWKTATHRLDNKLIKQQTLDFYNKVFQESRNKK